MADEKLEERISKTSSDTKITEKGVEIYSNSKGRVFIPHTSIKYMTDHEVVLYADNSKKE